MSRFPRLFVLALALLAVAILSLPAAAQPGRGGGQPGGGRRPGGMMGGGFGGGGANVLTVVNSKSVKDLLKITEKQSAKFTEIAEKASEARRERMMGGFQGIRDMDEAERNALFTKMREDAAKRAEETNKQVAEVLTDAQEKQLKKIVAQILLQSIGPAALAQKPVADYVGLAEKQVKQIEGVLQESRDARRKLYEGGFREMSQEQRDKAREEGDALRKKANAKAREILNEGQRAKVKELLSAERIELDRPQRRGGPGGGEARGRGGPGGGEGRGRGGPGGRRGGGGNRPSRPE